MNPMHREAASSVSVDLFQQLSTLDQQFTHPPMVSLRLGGLRSRRPLPGPKMG